MFSLSIFFLKNYKISVFRPQIPIDPELLIQKTHPVVFCFFTIILYGIYGVFCDNPAIIYRDAILFYILAGFIAGLEYTGIKLYPYRFLRIKIFYIGF
jgi:hypothetical protein